MVDELKIKDSVMRLLKGDITDLDIEAFVFYAQPNLVLGSGYGGAIAARGGPKIQEELKSLGGISTGEAVVTSAGNMKARYIIHAVGPRFQEENIEEKLRKTVLSALQRAEEKQIQRLAFPAMGAGFYGVPLDLCSRVTLGTVKEFLEKSQTIKEVVFCLRDSREYKAFLDRL
jgi:O-acetyl-ADP-ribose deacetylase